MKKKKHLQKKTTIGHISFFFFSFLFVHLHHMIYMTPAGIRFFLFFLFHFKQQYIIAVLYQPSNSTFQEVRLWQT